MEKIKNAIPVGAEIYKLENNDGKIKIYFKDHFSDAYNSSFRKCIEIDGLYDLDLISEELIGYVRPTKDYLERPKKIMEFIPFSTLQEAKDFLKFYRLLGDEQKTKELIRYKFDAQDIIMSKGTSKDRFVYIIHDYISTEIKSQRNYLNKMEIKLINDDITKRDFLFLIDIFNEKVSVYNEMNKECGFMNFPLYWIKNPIVKSIVGDAYVE